MAQNECTECNQAIANKYLENFTCKSSCTSPNVEDTEDKICKSAKYDTDNICPAGTYNELFSGSSSGACTACNGGSFCKTSGLEALSGACNEGYYCTTNAVYRANDDHLSSSGATGGRCDSGNFCSAGSTSQTSCTSGKYCSEDYLFAVTGDCVERYYCIGGTNAERPTDLSTMFGNICPMGNYCPTGVSSPTQCGSGKYQPNEGAAASSECLDCPPGKYCSTPGLSSESGTCHEGFYCEGANVTPTPATAVCAIGYYCPIGSVQQIQCDGANYQSTTGQGSCTTCPTNKYCFDTNSPQTCEAGFYCLGDNTKKP